jgi:hypothetical protein
VSVNRSECAEIRAWVQRHGTANGPDVERLLETVEHAMEVIRDVGETHRHCYVPPPTIDAARALLSEWEAEVTS